MVALDDAPGARLRDRGLARVCVLCYLGGAMQRDAYLVEAGVPLPTRRHKPPSMYPLAVMTVGDSFVSGSDSIEALRAAAYQYGKAHHMKFSVHRWQTGARVWRVE